MLEPSQTGFNISGYFKPSTALTTSSPCLTKTDFIKGSPYFFNTVFVYSLFIQVALENTPQPVYSIPKSSSVP